MRARVYLVLFLLLVVVGGSAFACSEAMRIREVVVLGCEERDPAEVVNLAAVHNEESVFALKFKQIREQIDVSPYFDVKDIDYVFPDKLRIEVSERKASAAIVHLDSVLIVDETGFVLETRQNLGSIKVPVVSGLRIVDGYQVCETVVSAQESQMDALQAILTQLQAQNAIQLISEINLDAVSDLWMTTVSGFEVRLGNFEQMADKIEWLRGVEPILASEGYTGGVITVSTGDHASFLDLGGATQPLPVQGEQEPEPAEGGEAPEEDVPEGEEEGAE